MPRSAGAMYETLSGKRRGFRAGLVRALLWPLSKVYREAIALRNRLYDRRLRRIRCLDCKVISVGNLTVGGTGKTPLVEIIARHVRDRGFRVTIVSRGYGSRHGRPSDEKLLLSENLPDVPHVLEKDRVAGGRTAVKEHQAQVVILDDAFQHRRLHRDLDVVTVDATNPFGFGHVLPRGLLREPPASLARADVVVITRAKLVPAAELARLEEEISGLAPEALIVQAATQVLSLQKVRGGTRRPDSLAARRAVAFCGIGNPEAFRRTLENLGVNLTAFLVFGDHHHYTARDIKAIEAAADAENAEIILTTQKDGVKMPRGFHWRHDLLIVRIGMTITKGEEEFKHRIDEAATTEEISP